MHPQAGCELNFSSAFELLVAVILSAQCTDKRVNLITEKLFKKYNKPSDFACLTLEELSPYIFSCGFYNNKGQNIISASKMIHEIHEDRVPDNMEELLSLPGVGRKTASVILSVAFGIPAVPVDTHVFRVSRRIGFTNGLKVEQVEKDLMNLFKKDKWNDLHHSLIFHGRYICKATKPNCGKCKINQLCQHYLSSVNGIK